MIELSGDKMIYLENISKKLNDFSLEIDLKINEGEIFGILGKSGSGKTTLLKVLDGITDFDNGSINFLKEINTATIFQDFNLLNNKTVYENIELPLKIKGLINENSKKDINKVIEFVGLINKINDYPKTLSGGEKQRVAIARSLVTRPNLLLCDEPTASLDDNIKYDILELFKKINEKYRTTIIIITHELSVAKAICNRVAIIEKGRILEILEIFNKKSKKYNNYLEYVKEELE